MDLFTFVYCCTLPGRPSEDHHLVLDIPSHMGIPGNEAGDKAAKQALDRPVSELGIDYADYKLHIKNYIDRLWQRRWDGCTENKLNKVEPVLAD